MNKDYKIRQQFQSKLSDYVPPVPEDGWERIEKSLVAASTAGIIQRRRYIGAAAAVFVLLIGSLLFLQTPWQENTPAVSETVVPPSEQSKKVTQQSATKENAPLIAQEQIKKTDKKVVAKAKKQTDITIASQSENAKEVKSPLFEFLRKKSDETPSETTDRNEQIQKLNGAEKYRLMEDVINAREREEMLLASVSPPKSDKLLVSLTGRGGLSSYQKITNSPMMLRSATVSKESEQMMFSNAPLQLAKDNTAKNISKMEHSQPISFGVTVSKSIIDGLFIETGLIYTYLYSQLRNVNIASRIEEKQQFHYLGIPLNVNYNIISLRDLDIYLTLGGLAEKDIAGRRKLFAEADSELTGNMEEQIIENIEQENTQFSANVGVGISYPIYRNLNLYGKVSGSYYFDAKNSYNTIYSDKKIMLDLNVGLRYQF